MLIQPIQWTIANPIGVDWPTKRQKKKTFVSTVRPVPVLCTRQVAHRTFFLSRQRDVIVSFSFGVCTVQTNFCVIKFFVVYCQNFVILSNFITYMDIGECIDQHVLIWTEKGQL